MLCGVQDALVQYSFCPVRHERTIAFGPELAFVVAVSGVEAAKTGAALGAYNRVSLAVTETLRRWREDSGAKIAPSLKQSRAVPRRWPGCELTAEDEYLRGRLSQFLTESERLIPAAAVASRRGPRGVRPPGRRVPVRC